jgi:hypothetical protein
VRVLAAIASIAILATVTACHGATDDRIVRITVARDGSPVATAVDHARADGHEAPLTSVLPLLPRDLPANAPQDADCPYTYTVIIRFATGRSVSYGPCGLPKAIGWLASAVGGQARQWSPQLVDHTTITGALPAERRALEKLLRTLAPTPIRHIEFTSLRHQVRRAGVGWDVDAGRSSRGAWEAGLLVRLYRDAASRLHLRPVLWLDSDQHNGPINVKGIGPPVGNLDSVRRVVAGAGARVVEVRRIMGAVEITVRANSPGAFLRYTGRRFLQALRGPQPRASVYFAVQDAYGSVVYGGGWMPGMGMGFGRPDLDSCGPIVHGGIFGYEPPPCPA